MLFPQLYQVYLDFTNMAVDSGRAFSDANFVVTNTRNTLSTNSMGALVVQRSILRIAEKTRDVLARLRNVFL